MRCDFFTIPAQGGEAETEALNRLLAAVRVLSVERQFVADGAQSFWSIYVLSHHASEQPQPGPKRAQIDYKEVLSAEDFALYARLRDLRKAISAEDAIPPYSVFTNEQLAEIVRRRASSLAALGEIEGIGAARLEKYGRRFIEALASAPAVSGAAA